MVAHFQLQLSFARIPFFKLKVFVKSLAENNWWDGTLNFIFEHFNGDMRVNFV